MIRIASASYDTCSSALTTEESLDLTVPLLQCLIGIFTDEMRRQSYVRRLLIVAGQASASGIVMIWHGVPIRQWGGG